jgi:hypothetical protein
VEPDCDPYSEGRYACGVAVIGGPFAGGTEAAEADGSLLHRPSGRLDHPTITVTVVGEPLPPTWWEVPQTPPDPPASATASPVLAPTPARGCSDCARLTGDEPVQAGEELTLSYSGFQPAEEVTLVMRSTPVTLGTFTADMSGVVTATVTVPGSTGEGAHTLALSGPLTGDRVVGFGLAAAQEKRGAVAAPASAGPSRTVGPPPGQPTETPIAAPMA